jgi:hypothetical protein
LIKPRTLLCVGVRGFLPAKTMLPDMVVTPPENPALHCQERHRLIGIYLDAVTEISLISVRIADMKNESWRDATHEARGACETALADLNAHRKEHGC